MAQDIRAHLALVLGPLGLSDPKAQPLMLGALGREESPLCPHPGPACVCAAGICVGAGGTCQGLWSVRDLRRFTCRAPGCVFASVSGCFGQSIKVWGVVGFFVSMWVTLSVGPNVDLQTLAGITVFV